MGTSSPYGGPGGDTPLVPSWLSGGEPGGTPPGGPPEGSPPQPENGNPPSVPPSPRQPPDRSPPPPADRGRFRAARTNFSRFARSGGSDRASLGRAVSGYVSTASGGARTAAQRMGSSRSSGARLIGFLSDVSANGTRAALRTLNLENLAGRPVEEIFLGLADYVCPNTGTVDESIARDAFIETIADLAGAGITDLDGLTVDQIQTFFEIYATHAIEARLCNDIGTKAVSFPTDIQAAQQVQAQLQDFIRRGVSDALTQARADFEALTPVRVLDFVEGVYKTAFEILEVMGEEEAQT